MTLDKSPESIHIMFNKIAQEYDYLNNIMSFGLQKFVKQSAVRCLKIKEHDNVIDLCCGTGDLARIIKKIQPLACVIGIDFSENMLNIAKDKSNDIKYFQGDIINLPYKDNSFDVALMGFGLRNIHNAEKAVEEVYRILKPNGRFLHLDFGEKNIFSRIYDILTPFIIKNFTKNTLPYRYLIESKRIFPTPKELIKDFESKGFRLVREKSFLFGVISAQVMQKDIKII